MEKNEKKKAVIPLRRCGHPKFPTLDMIFPTKMVGYCLYCIVEKLGLRPVIVMEVDQPEDWQDQSKIKIVLDE